MDCGASDNHISVFFRRDEQDVLDGVCRKVIFCVGSLPF